MLESEELEKIDKKMIHMMKKYCFEIHKNGRDFLLIAAGPIFNLILAFIFFLYRESLFFF